MRSKLYLTNEFPLQMTEIFAGLGIKPFIFVVGEEVDGKAVQERLIQKTQDSIMPKVFIKGVNMGGPSEIQKLSESGKLAQIVEEESNEIDQVEYDYDVIVIGGGSGGLAAAKVIGHRKTCGCLDYDYLHVHFCSRKLQFWVKRSLCAILLFPLPWERPGAWGVHALMLVVFRRNWCIKRLYITRTSTIQRVLAGLHLKMVGNF